MRLLLDTHAFVWWLEGNTTIRREIRDLIDGDTSEVHVSAATAWEIATKFRLGKLPSAARAAEDCLGCIESHGFRALSVTVEHGQRAGSLPGPHRDPFDRMLVAQALVENLALVSNERAFDQFGVQRLW